MAVFGIKRKKSDRKSFHEWMTHRFRLLFVDEDELRTMKSLMVNRAWLITLTVIEIIVVGVLAVILYRNSPFQKRENEEQTNIRQQLVTDILKMDSIEKVMAIQEVYTRNLQDILMGKVIADSVPSLDSLVGRGVHTIEDISELEQSFVVQYEERERYNVTMQSAGASEVQSRNLMRPTIGMVAEPFDARKGHYGVDIAANPEESIVSVMDGKVILASYTSESGYVICIHHTGDMVSVYKYCSKLLKKEGEKVRAGDVIALVGTTNTTYSSSHLHFELWYEGEPLDPQKYIVF